MDKWKEIIAFANKVGAITCTNYGAISSMPTLEEVNNIQYNKSVVRHNIKGKDD